MQDGAIVHLTEDGAVTRKVPDDHVTARMHTPSFRGERTCFWTGATILVEFSFLTPTSSKVR